MSNKNTLFTIGQFAALHEINKKTLMWYDSVGIFKPAVVKKNGYRYYTYYQSESLETILRLRKLNVSIKEIESFMKNRSAAALKKLLEEKITELDQNISHLKSIRKALTAQKESMSMLINLDISKISIVEKSQSALAMISTERDTPLEKDIAHVIAEVKKYPSCREQDVTYGSMIPVESLYRGDFDDYSALFICITNPTTKKGLHLQPEGRYLQGFCKGSWDKLPKKYEEMLKYAADHGLTLCGYSYEIGINEIVIDDMEDYITQIEIPIKPY